MPPGTTRSGQPDSNRRPQPWQGCALPAELCPRRHKTEPPEGWPRMRPDSTPTTQFRQLDSGCPGSPSYRSCILLSGRLSVVACMLPKAPLTKSGIVGIPCKVREHSSPTPSFSGCRRARKSRRARDPTASDYLEADFPGLAQVPHFHGCSIFLRIGPLS